MDVLSHFSTWNRDRFCWDLSVSITVSAVLPPMTTCFFSPLSTRMLALESIKLAFFISDNYCFDQAHSIDRPWLQVTTPMSMEPSRNWQSPDYISLISIMRQSWPRQCGLLYIDQMNIFNFPREHIFMRHSSIWVAPCLLHNFEFTIWMRSSSFNKYVLTIHEPLCSLIRLKFPWIYFQETTSSTPSCSFVRWKYSSYWKLFVNCVKWLRWVLPSSHNWSWRDWEYMTWKQLRCVRAKYIWCCLGTENMSSAHGALGIPADISDYLRTTNEEGCSSWFGDRNYIPDIKIYFYDLRPEGKS